MNAFFEMIAKNESIYFGKRGSQLHLLAYNKKAENDEQGTIDQYPDVEHVTRIEARIKVLGLMKYLRGTVTRLKV